MNASGITWTFWRNYQSMECNDVLSARMSTCISWDYNVNEYSLHSAGSRIYETILGRFSQVHQSVIYRAKIGSFVSIAPGVCVGGGGRHPLDQISTHSVFYMSNTYRHPKIRFSRVDKFDGYPRPVSIRHDVWIGAGARIKDGVTIGTGAVIGANSLVVKDVPNYAIVGGVPAKIIRFRHDEILRQMQLESEWWN